MRADLFAETKRELRMSGNKECPHCGFVFDCEIQGRALQFDNKWVDFCSKACARAWQRVRFGRVIQNWAESRD